MRTLDELGISNLPWEAEPYHTVTEEWRVMRDGVRTPLASSLNQPTARLIAAAPMLYEALREAVIESCHECMEKAKCCPHKYDGGCFVTKWRKAIAAASGESEEDSK